MSNAVVKYEKPELPVAAEAQETANALQIIDQDTYEFAMEMAREWKEAMELWEDKRKTYADPINKLKQQVQDDFMPVINGFKAAIDAVKAKGKRHLQTEELKRIEKQRELDAAHAETQKKAQATAALIADTNPTLSAALTAAATVSSAPVVAGPAKVAGAVPRKRWKGKIVDRKDAIFSLLANPALAALVIVDQEGLNKAIAASKGELKIGGVENYQDTDIALT